jgi:hypothetical protein
MQVNINNALDRRTNQGTIYRWPRFIDPRQIIYTTTVAF